MGFRCSDRILTLRRGLQSNDLSQDINERFIANALIVAWMSALANWLKLSGGHADRQLASHRCTLERILLCRDDHCAKTGHRYESQLTSRRPRRTVADGVVFRFPAERDRLPI